MTATSSPLHLPRHIFRRVYGQHDIVQTDLPFEYPSFLVQAIHLGVQLFRVGPDAQQFIPKINAFDLNIC